MAQARVVDVITKAGKLQTIQTAIVIGALLFIYMVVMMGLSLLHATYRDGRPDGQGLPTTAVIGDYASRAINT